MVDKYHFDLKDLEDKLIAEKDRIDKQFAIKFQELEDTYQESTHNLQAHYDELFYTREDTEHHYYQLLHEYEDMQQAFHNEEL